MRRKRKAALPGPVMDRGASLFLAVMAVIVLVIVALTYFPLHGE